MAGAERHAWPQVDQRDLAAFDARLGGLPRGRITELLGPASAGKTALMLSTLARTLRRAGIAVEQDYRGNMKRRMQRANKLNARAAVIIGDDELSKGVAQVKDLDSQAQREVPLDGLVEALKG